MCSPGPEAYFQNQEAQTGSMTLLSSTTGLMEIIGFCQFSSSCTWCSECLRISGLAETSLPLPSSTFKIRKLIPQLS